MKTSEIVAALAAHDADTVASIVNAAEHTREANSLLAGLEPAKKRRGRKPGTKNKVKAVVVKPSPKKPTSKKKPTPDAFTE